MSVSPGPFPRAYLFVEKVEGSPVNAVSLGATTGGGKVSPKARDFNAALVALGEGWLVCGGEEEQQPPDRPASKGATARISTEVPCKLQVSGFRVFLLLLLLPPPREHRERARG